MECWVKEFCKSADTEQCNQYCIGYQQLKYLYETSNMPLKYRGLYDLKLDDIDLQVYQKLKKFKSDIVENVKDGKGVFLFSLNKGNGKTSWACILMNEYFKKIALTNNLEPKGLFISVPVFLQGLRDDFNRDVKEMEQVKKKIKEVDIVIWDDIGAEMPSDWVKETLYSFINYRISNNLSQFYTSNIKLPILKNNLGDRIVSRIRGQSLDLNFKGADKR